MGDSQWNTFNDHAMSDEWWYRNTPSNIRFNNTTRKKVSLAIVKVYLDDTKVMTHPSLSNESPTKWKQRNKKPTILFGSFVRSTLFDFLISVANAKSYVIRFGSSLFLFSFQLFVAAKQKCNQTLMRVWALRYANSRETENLVLIVDRPRICLRMWNIQNGWDTMRKWK